MDELPVTKVATLDVSAASGLVALPDRICLVADDEVFMAVYRLDGTPLPRIPLFPDALPEDHAGRKRRKPDLEAVTLLPDGRVLAFGSGSSPARRRAAVVDPMRPDSVEVVDLGGLYDRLAMDVPELNIEGAAVSGHALWLMQRGNGAARFNAVVDLDLGVVMRSLDDDRVIGLEALRGITEVDLGELDGVDLSLTDAIELPSGVLAVSAAAEDTTDPYADGEVTGSIVGVLRGGRLAEHVRIDPTLKLEGIAVAGGTPTAPRIFLVADPDDRAQQATLYTATLPFG